MAAEINIEPLPPAGNASVTVIVLVALLYVPTGLLLASTNCVPFKCRAGPATPLLLITILPPLAKITASDALMPTVAVVVLAPLAAL